MRKGVIFGTPITPRRHIEQLAGESFCVSYWNRDKLNGQLERCIALTAADGMLLVDNGAFSAWMSGATMGWDYWQGFVEWSESIADVCPQAVIVVPDVIDGDEAANAELAHDFLASTTTPFARLMVVWHMHESLEHLRYLLEGGWGYVAIGSSGEYAKPGTAGWHARIAAAMATISDAEADGYRPHVHMMRAQGQHTDYDFDSSDSTNVARNHSRYKREGEGHVGRFARRVRERIEATADGLQRVETPLEVAVDAARSDLAPATYLEVFRWLLAEDEAPALDSAWKQLPLLA